MHSLVETQSGILRAAHNRAADVLKLEPGVMSPQEQLVVVDEGEASSDPPAHVCEGPDAVLQLEPRKCCKSMTM